MLIPTPGNHETHCQRESGSLVRFKHRRRLSLLKSMNYLTADMAGLKRLVCPAADDTPDTSSLVKALAGYCCYDKRKKRGKRRTICVPRERKPLPARVSRQARQHPQKRMQGGPVQVQAGIRRGLTNRPNHRTPRSSTSGISLRSRFKVWTSGGAGQRAVDDCFSIF